MNRADSRVHPRAVRWRGHIEVAGVWFPEKLISRAVATQRIMHSWTHGDWVVSNDDGLLWMFSQPARRNVQEIPGTAVVWIRESSLLSVAPLDGGEQQRLLSKRGTSTPLLVLVQGGMARTVSLEEFTHETPEEWLDVHDWSFVRLENLAPDPGKIHHSSLTLETRNARSLLNVPEPSKAQREFLKETAAGTPEDIPGSSYRRHSTFAKLSALTGLTALGAIASVGGEVSSVALLFSVLFYFLARQTIRTNAPGPGKHRPESLTVALLRWLFETLPIEPPRERDSSYELPGTGASRKLSRWQRLQRWAALQIETSHVGQLLSRRQERYLRRVLRAFDEGDIDEALKLAVPIAADGTIQPSERFPLLGNFRPREELQVLEQGIKGLSRTVTLPEEVISLLRRRYRTAVERLERAGRIEEAAFTLLTLLDSPEEGLALLVDNGQAERAARIAESRRLSPETIVRLWFLAGNEKRAIAIAKRHQAFWRAFVWLMDKHPERGQQFGRYCAEREASRGDYFGALQYATRLPSMKDHVARWTELAIQTGGIQALELRLARLAKTAQGDEDSVRHVTEDFTALSEALGSSGPQGAATRRMLADKLFELRPSTPHVRLLHSRVARQLLRDIHAVQSGESLSFPRLARHMGVGRHNYTWRADLPPNLEIPRGSPPETEKRTIRSARRGAVPVLDAVRLPNRRMLVALGDSGAALLSPTGELLVHFDEPTDALVSSLSGDTYLGVRRVGSGVGDERVIVQRFDVRRFTSSPLGTIRSHVWSDTCDGASWFVAEDRNLVMLDLLTDRPKSLWHVETSSSDIEGIFVNNETLNVRLAGNEIWSYDRRRLLLRSRGRTDEHYLKSRVGDSSPAETVLFTPMVSATTPWRALRLQVEPTNELPAVTPEASATVETKRTTRPDKITRLVAELIHQDGTLMNSITFAPTETFVSAVAGSRGWALVRRRLDGAETRIAVTAYTWGRKKAKLEVSLPNVESCRVRFEQDALTIADDLGRITVLHMDDLRSPETIVMPPGPSSPGRRVAGGAS